MTLNEFCQEGVATRQLDEGEARRFKRWVTPGRSAPPPTLTLTEWLERLQTFRNAATAASQGDPE